MSRNKIQTNKAIFDRLKAWATVGIDAPLSETVSGANYFIETTKVGQSWLTDASISKEMVFFRTASALVLKLGDDILYCLVGFPSLVLDEDHFFDIDSPSSAPSPLGGLVTLAIAELELLPIVSPHEVLESVLIDVGTTADPIKVPVDAIRGIFPAMRFFRTKPDSPFSGAPIYRVISWVALDNRSEFSSLDFEPDLVDDFQDAILDTHSPYPYQCMYMALTATRWEYAYLELYRTIERLFAIPEAVSLVSQIGIAKPVLDVIADLENEIGWRPKEEEALSKIFGQLPEAVLDFLVAAIPTTQTIAPDISKPRVAGRSVYKLRNSIVHYRPALNAPSYENLEWNRLIQGLIRASSAAYSTFASHLV